MKKQLNVRCYSLIIMIIIMMNIFNCVFAENKKDDDVLIWGTVNPPTIINPILTSHSVSAPLITLMFNRLVKLDYTGNIIPDLALRWDISSDGLIYIFYLRKDVKFHDDKPLTADDVIYTFNEILNENNNSPYRSYFSLVDRFEQVDKYTLKIILIKPFSGFLSKLSTREIVPKHVLSGKDIVKSDFNYNPIGSGPYMFDNWDKKTNIITIKRNDHYFDGEAKIKKIMVKSYLNNKELLAAFMRQEIDLIHFIDPEDYKLISQDPAFRAFKIDSRVYYAITYNPKNSILFEPEIRRAIAHAINVYQIMDILQVGGEKCIGPFHPDSFGFSNRVGELKYDPLEAQIMLQHRGWTDKDNDGVLEKGSKELEIKMMVDKSNKFLLKLAKIIRQQLSEVGIKVTIVLFDMASQLSNDFIDENGIQAWLRMYMGFAFDSTEGYDIVGSWYSLSSDSSKIWEYKNDEIDMLFQESMQESDISKRTDNYKQMHEIIYNDQPACFLFFPSSFHAVSKRVKNCSTYFSQVMPVYSMKDWFLESDGFQINLN